MRRLALVLLGCLWASPASAAVYFAHGFDIGCPGALGSCNGVALDATSSQQLWKVGGTTTVNGSPSFSTTVDSAATASNLYSLQINPASGATEYVGTDAGISAGVASLKLGCKLRVDDDGGFGAKREVAVFRDGGASGAYTRGAILSMAHATTINGTDYYTLNAYYGSQSETVCSGSNYNGRRCTSVTTDCPTTNAAEAQCANSLLAVSPIIAEGAWVQFILSLDTGSPAAGDVTVGLWEGTAGLTPAVYARGSGTRKVGYCTGGSVAGKPCDANGDCTGGGSCTLTDKVTAKEVRFGATDTGTGSVDYRLDDCWIYDGTARTNVRFETLTPNGDGASLAEWVDQGGASSIDEDIDENPADDATTYATRGSGTTQARGDVTLSDIPKPSTSPTPIAVAISAIGQKNWSTAGRTVDLRFSEWNGTNELTGTTVQVNDSTNWTDDGAASAYHPMWAQTFANAADGAAWTTKGLTTIDALQLRLDRVAASNVNQEMRITRAIAEVVVQQPDAPVPAVIPDHDRDGEDTVCIAGDSTFHNDDFRFAVVSNLIEPTNIYYYTRGGSKLGDTLAQFSTLIEGGTGGFLPLDAKRGTTGKTCDVLIVEHFANVFTAADPAWGPNFRGISQSGYCQDDGGADQGNPCWCDGKTDDWTSHFGATPAPNITPAARYCVNRGDFAQPGQNRASGIPQIDCRCSTASDCQVGGDGVTATCTGGLCVGNALGTCAANASANVRTAFVTSGCLNTTGCPSGVCVQGRTPQAIEQGLSDLKAAIDIRPTPAATPPVGGKPIVVYASAPEGVGLACWMWTRASASAYRGVVIPWAKARNLPFIDMWARFHRECNMYQFNCTDPCPYERACFRDDVHWNQRGQLVAAQAVTECLTNALPGEAAGTRTHDGTCTSSVCTTGLVGDPCTTATDCSTWSCDFGAQP